MSLDLTSAEVSGKAERLSENPCRSDLTASSVLPKKRGKESTPNGEVNIPVTEGTELSVHS